MLWIDEWFRGLRPHFWARSYPVVYMARCLFFASSIYATYNTKTSAFSMVFQTQALFTGYILIMRPFEEKIMNHLDGLNNLIVTFLLFLMFYYDTEKEWTRRFTVFFILIIILTVIANLVITFGKSQFLIL